MKLLVLIFLSLFNSLTLAQYEYQLNGSYEIKEGKKVILLNLVLDGQKKIISSVAVTKIITMRRRAQMPRVVSIILVDYSRLSFLMKEEVCKVSRFSPLKRKQMIRRRAFLSVLLQGIAKEALSRLKESPPIQSALSTVAKDKKSHVRKSLGHQLDFVEFMKV